MTDERKAIEQALQAAAMELKAKGAAADPEAEAPAEQLPAAPEAAPEETPKAEAPEASDAEMEKAPAEEKQPEQKAKADSKKTAADALKEIARVRRNKIIGITAAVLAVMVGIFLIANGNTRSAKHGGKPTVMEDGTKVYPDGAQELADGTFIDENGTTEQPDGTVITADGTVTQPDGTVIAPDGTTTKPDGTVVAPDGTTTQPDGTVVPPQPVDPGDTNTANVDADNGGKGGDADTPWSTMTDSDYQIAIRRLNAYSGSFLEDGQDEEVTNVLALQFRNDGTTDVQYAEYVFTVNGEEIPFKLTNLPAGQRCVVLAANKHAFNADEVLKLKSRLVAQVEALPSADEQLLLVNNGDNTLSIMNLTDHNLPVVRVFYKTFYPDENTFIGGITYTVEIKNIPANGSSGAVAPSHFNSDYSMFVGSGVYEE